MSKISPEETPIYNLWKRCLEVIGGYRKEDQGLRVKVEMDEASIESEIIPQPKSYSRSYTRRKIVPTKEQILNALKGQEELVTFEETDNVFTVTPKKFLDELWPPINESLRAIGFRWHRENKRWEAPKK